MPRQPEIHTAFITTLRLNPKGFRYLRTDDFVRALQERNWHFSRDDANRWIERYQPDFADKTIDDSANRYWILRNMGRIF